MGEQRRTFEWNDDNLPATILAPLFDLVECMYQDACVDNNEICVLVRRAVVHLAWPVIFPVLWFRLVPLLVVLLLRLLVTRSRTGLDDGPVAMGVGMGDAEVGLWLTSISPISRCGPAGDRLFELFDLMGKKCGPESAGHGELVGSGGCGRSLRDRHERRRTTRHLEAHFCFCHDVHQIGDTRNDVGYEALRRRACDLVPPGIINSLSPHYVSTPNVSPIWAPSKRREDQPGH